MNNIFHKHKYKIIGIGSTSKDNYIEVDVMCKCGRCKTVYIEKRFESEVIKQVAQVEYLNVPRIIFSVVNIE